MTFLILLTSKGSATIRRKWTKAEVHSSDPGEVLAEACESGEVLLEASCVLDGAPKQHSDQLKNIDSHA